MPKRLREILGSLPPGVAASLLVHALLLVGLFFVPGVLRPPAPGEQFSRLNVDPSAKSELPPPPPKPNLRPLETPEALADPVIREKAAEEEDAVFVRERSLPFVAGPPSDLPPSTSRRIIGAGGGAPVGEPAAGPARPAPPVEAAPPPAPKKAVPERTPSPSYPARAVDRGLEGRVLLLVEVRPDGSVGDITVTKSSGHPILDRAAAAAVRKWHFRAATAQGQPVRSFVEVPINFRLTE